MGKVRERYKGLGESEREREKGQQPQSDSAVAAVCLGDVMIFST